MCLATADAVWQKKLAEAINQSVSAPRLHRYELFQCCILSFSAPTAA
jgi:hypothetical protein